MGGQAGVGEAGGEWVDGWGSRGWGERRGETPQAGG